MDVIAPLFAIVAAVTAVPGGEKITDFHSQGNFPIEECVNGLPEAGDEVFKIVVAHGYAPGTFAVKLACMEVEQPGVDH